MINGLSPTGAAGVLLALFLLASACGSGDATDRPASQATPEEQSSPSATEESPAPGDESPEEEITYQVWFHRGERLAQSWRTQPTTPGIAAAALESTLAGPAPDESEDGLGTAIPAATELLGLNIDEGVATVDLSGEFEAGGGALSMRMRVAQVVFVLTQFPTVDGVEFHLDGEAVNAIGGEGVVTSEALARGDFEDLAPAIVVDRPFAGQTVASPLVVSGSANVFEATVSMRLVDHAGAEIARTFATATCGSGCRGEYSKRLRFSVPERTQGTLEVYEESAEDGSAINVVRIPIVLVP